MAKGMIQRTLFGDAGMPPPPPSSFIDSIQRGSIAEVFARTVLHFVPPKDRPPVLDLTHRVGDFWRYCAEWYRVARLDLDMDGVLRAGGHIDAVCDFRAPLPFRDQTFAAVVFDPPWSMESSKTGKPGYAKAKYSAPYKSMSEMRLGASAKEWARVLRDDGILIARLQDQHHRGRYIPLSDIMPKAISASFVRMDEIIHEIGGFPPRFAMVYPPKSRKIHSFFHIYFKVAHGHRFSEGSFGDHEADPVEGEPDDGAEA